MSMTGVAGVDIFVPFVALVEILTAIHTLILDPRSKANQHLAALLVVFAVNSVGLGWLLTASNAAEAQLPTLLLAATSPVLAPGLLMSFVVLFYPDWLSGRWRWAWRLGYLLAVLPLALTLSDALLGTRWWFVPLDPSSYRGGFVESPLYLQGGLAPLVRWVNLRFLWLVAMGLALRAGWFDPQVSDRARRLARLMAGGMVADLLLYALLPLVQGEGWAPVLAHIIFVSLVAFAGMTRLLSDAGLRALLARLPIRRKLRMGFALLTMLILIMGGITIVTLNASHQALMAEPQSAELEAITQEISEHQARSMVLILCTVVLTFNVSGLIVYELSGQIAEPIQALGRTATRLAEGELSVRAPVMGHDEVAVAAAAFNAMAGRLQELLTGLEQQVAERTRSLARRARQIEAAAEVGRVVTSVLDPTELLERVAQAIGEHFNFYHVGIFLLDDQREWAVLRAANSPGGQELLARGHRVKVGGESLVGWVAYHCRPRLALDLEAESSPFPETLLPDTRSEMALPIMAADRILGVLDVQSKRKAAFDNQDLAVLQLVAEQVAVAIENARLFAEAQATLRELRTFYRTYSQEAWRELVARQMERPGYRFGPTGLTPDPGDYRPEIAEAVQAGRPVVHVDGGGSPTLAIPLMLRGQIIGALDFRRAPGDPDWSEEELTLAQAVAEQVALALENARLFEVAQTRAAREQTLSQMTAHLTRSIDMDTVLQTAVRELGQLLDAAEVSVHIGPPEAPGSSNGDEQKSLVKEG